MQNILFFLLNKKYLLNKKHLLNKYSGINSILSFFYQIRLKLNQLFIYNFNYPFPKIYGYFFISNKKPLLLEGKDLIFPSSNKLIINHNNYIIKNFSSKLNIKVLFNFNLALRI